MAKKSKTQKAKASANRAAKKARAAEQENVAPVIEEAPKKRLFNKKDSAETKPTPKPAKETKKASSKSKKRRFGFLSDVRSELRRVTWPSKQEVLQWSGVVVVALIFFGVFVVVLDDWVVTPILFAISSLGA